MAGMRFSTHVMLFIVIANVLIGVADGAGMWDDWGIEIDAGVSDKIDDTQEAFDSLRAGGLGADTLINLFVFGGKTLQAGFAIVTSLPTFLENIGVPGFLSPIPNAMLAILVGRDILAVLIGRVV